MQCDLNCFCVRSSRSSSSNSLDVLPPKLEQRLLGPVRHCYGYCVSCIFILTQNVKRLGRGSGNLVNQNVANIITQKVIFRYISFINALCRRDGMCSEFIRYSVHCSSMISRECLVHENRWDGVSNCTLTRAMFNIIN